MESTATDAVVKSTRWSCDVFKGTPDALIAAGIVKPEELQPQEGRPDWRMVFLPNGEPCPPSRKAWREPGYKAIWLFSDGTCQVEVTVPKEEQASRRKAEKDAEHEREQLRINKELEESGHKFRDWKLQHGFSDWCEWWEGTKEQLQKVGIGVGVAFPGEPGAPAELHCKCPLGFDVSVELPSGYDRAKGAAGIYRASSRYAALHKEPPQFVQHAPGVMREVWTPAVWWKSYDTYTGTDAALVAAGLVRSLDLFPGKPGRNKVQASYHMDWTAATSSPHRTVMVTIRKRGKGNQFSVEVPTTPEEAKRRDELHKLHDSERTKRQKEQADERRKLRQLSGGGISVEEFRAKREDELETCMNILWRMVFGSPDGVLSYDLPEGSEEWDELAEAFQTLREMVREAPVRRDAQLESKLVTQQKLAAARNDKGLQSMLQAVQGRLAD